MGGVLQRTSPPPPLPEWIKRPATNTLEDGKGALIHINLQDLFVGKEATATTVADLRSTGLRNIEAVRVTVTLDQPLLSRPQSRALNPMTVHFHALHCMPDMPTPFSDLDSLCHPTFLKFSFLDDKVHVSSGPLATLLFQHPCSPPPPSLLAGPLDSSFSSEICDHLGQPRAGPGV